MNCYKLLISALFSIHSPNHFSISPQYLPISNFTKAEKFFHSKHLWISQVSWVGNTIVIKVNWYQHKYMHHKTSIRTKICIIWHEENKALVLNVNSMETCECGHMYPCIVWKKIGQNYIKLLSILFRPNCFCSCLFWIPAHLLWSIWALQADNCQEYWF